MRLRNPHLLTAAVLISALAVAPVLVAQDDSGSDEEVRDYQIQLPDPPEGKVTFQPPSEKDLPDNQYGDMVRKGRDIFINTQSLRGEHVFNDQNCVNCHLDAGRLANSAPMWAAFGVYPAYRGKNDKVNTLTDRIQGCFTYSMNGVPPEAGSEEIVALETYLHWLSTGAPINESIPGRSYPTLEETGQQPSIERGAEVYAAQCAICHEDDGSGQKVGDRVVFPPLWGEGAYNWGAGMHRVNTAANFIKANMPLGKPYSLSDQQAWDVAAFVNSHERPQDPRRRNMGSLEETVDTFHNHMGFYGDEINGERLGEGDNYGEAPASSEQ